MASYISSSSLSTVNHVTVALALLLVVFTGSSSAKLSTGFYSKSCPKVFSTVRPVLINALSKAPRLGASLLRLHFHDCFVNGCDGSVLLDDTASTKGEKTAGPNNRSIRGFKVVDDIKTAVEKVCPGVVSCADILAIAARDSVVILGGPNWAVKVGRRDSKTASFSDANNGNLPPPTFNLTNLISSFRAKGLSTQDMVALSGGHTIGQTRCLTFRDRIYNETNIDSSFAKLRQSTCPRNTGGRKNLAPLDIQTPNHFDNKYFKNLLGQKGLLHSDQELYNGGSTDSLVKTYSNNPKTFSNDFITAMIKMGDIEPLTGSSGEIRKNCRRAN
ncbi:peroxidase 4-like [Juglans microcarpa x Juglans regia]|uniref:peroxidase 4-like n=1 Tax=Juglans microcarpa x Juglans regia TaxID=2249226 RepID=UPI001B7E5CAC|nr:peroxidase 4-like [Juglans microcarpa x Juglans regia]